MSCKKQNAENGDVQDIFLAWITAGGLEKYLSGDPEKTPETVEGYLKAGSAKLDGDGTGLEEMEIGAEGLRPKTGEVEAAMMMMIKCNQVYICVNGILSQVPLTHV